MDSCPPEVLHQVCRHLDFDGVSAFRCAAKKYADIGAGYITDRIRFHCTEESLIRCKELVENAAIRNSITTLVFEGNLLADIGCLHRYRDHYDEPHHQDEKPRPPPAECTARQRRLYDRNLAKFERDVKQKYDTYRAALSKQQALIKSPLYSQIGRAITLALPKLEHISLTTVARCAHVLSDRFMQSFALTCAMPMEQDSGPAVVQLKHLVLPAGQPLRNLKSLNVHILSPAFFGSESPNSLSELFQSLRSVTLSFRLSHEERSGSQGEDLVECYAGILKDKLHGALAAATDLECMAINFVDFFPPGLAIDVKRILGETSWAKLKSLDLDSISADEKYLTDALQRQPALQTLALGCAVLKAGTWPSMLESLQNLELKEFSAGGFFEDESRFYAMDHIDRDAWIEDRMQISMSELIEWFVTEPPEPDSDYNPLEDNSFADLDELMEDDDSIPDSDLMTEDEDLDSDMPSLEGTESEESDIEMPDLIDPDFD